MGDCRLFSQKAAKLPRSSEKTGDEKSKDPPIFRGVWAIFTELDTERDSIHRDDFSCPPVVLRRSRIRLGIG